MMTKKMLTEEPQWQDSVIAGHFPFPAGIKVSARLQAE